MQARLRSRLWRCFSSRSRSDRIRLKQHGGDGSAEVEALVGDKLLDVFLYRRLIDRMSSIGPQKCARMAKLRDRIVSNRALAECGRPFIVPIFFTEQQWMNASVHQRGTAVEAAIGRLFLRVTTGQEADEGTRRRLIQMTTGILTASEQWCKEQEIIVSANQAVLRKRQRMNAVLSSRNENSQQSPENDRDEHCR